MELGSEFWNVPQCDIAAALPDENTQFVLSGRTALELVARDLITERKIRSVCLPAYCCDSMLFPFQRAGLELRFYDVVPSDDGVQRLLPENHGCDAVLLLDYFGFSQKETAALAEREHDRGTAIILDCVQSLYSESDAAQYADYSVTSWRKWFFSCAAAAKKHDGEWLVQPTVPANKQYVSLRKEAAEKKAAYLTQGRGDKQAFLDAFAQAEELLDTDFSDYAADLESVNALCGLDIPFLKQRRRENASVIYEALVALDNQQIRPLFPQMGVNDTPLFVPVLVNPAIRTELRRFLIRNQVYSPIHWPDAQTGGGAVLYASEMSLLCDQRYTTADIEKEMNLIKEFFKYHA